MALKLKRGRTNPRIAILTGAGASYGAGDVTPSAPPSDQDYSLPWLHIILTPGSLAGEAAEAFHADFESAMVGLWESFSEGSSRLLIDMGTFFTRFEPSGVEDCYSQLVRWPDGQSPHPNHSVWNT